MGPESKISTSNRSTQLSRRYDIRSSRRMGGSQHPRGIVAALAILSVLGIASCSASRRANPTIVSRSDQSVLLVPDNSVSGVGWCLVVIGANGHASAGKTLRIRGMGAAGFEPATSRV
jgi:hypothetical protein